MAVRVVERWLLYISFNKSELMAWLINHMEMNMNIHCTSACRVLSRVFEV